MIFHIVKVKATSTTFFNNTTIRNSYLAMTLPTFLNTKTLLAYQLLPNLKPKQT